MTHRYRDAVCATHAGVKVGVNAWQRRSLGLQLWSMAFPDLKDQFRVLQFRPVPVWWHEEDIGES